MSVVLAASAAFKWRNSAMNIAHTGRSVLRFPRLMTAFAVALALCAPTSRAAEQALRFAHIHSPEHSTQRAAEMISDGLKMHGGGQVEIRILPNAQLGTERQILEGLMIGTIDMGAIAGNILQGFEASAGLTSLPYLIRDFDHAFKVEGGPIGKEVEKRILAKTGVRVIGYSTTGIRVIVTPGKPIVSLVDFKGLKIRVPESPVMVATFKALGANPTPIPFGELYTALQTRVVDAAESPPAVLNDIKLFEVAKAMSLTNHVYTNQYMVINEKAYQRLSEKERAALLAAGREATTWQRAVTVKGQNEMIDHLQKTAGVKVYPVDTAPLQKAVAPVYQDYAKTIGGMQLIDAVVKM
ncbi:MAG: TRAP transporter substrate-binding protein [Betaproteobacteria bacterium]|nr:TRAP transporter substrate-binding protein [Betaproteobacteria bacterium]